MHVFKMNMHAFSPKRFTSTLFYLQHSVLSKNRPVAYRAETGEGCSVFHYWVLHT